MSPDAEQPPEERRVTSQEAIIRIDMRTQFMLEEVKSMKTVLDGKADTSDLADVKALVNKVENTIDTKFVSQNEFHPIKVVVYGMVGLILTIVLTAMVALVILRGGQ